MLYALRILLCFFSVLGVLNCALIEPAHAFYDEAAHAESGEESDSCFVHCVAGHQWGVPVFLALSHDSIIFNRHISEILSFLPDPPVGSIFHPPLAV